MGTRKVIGKFFQSTYKVHHVHEETPYDTEEQGRARFERKVFTYVVGASDRHVLRRWK